jgi:hypothetical protein
VLNVMQLVDVQHSLVGNVERRGISGGQRKRVNIGVWDGNSVHLSVNGHSVKQN